MMIDISAEEGSVGEDEAELLDRVFHFHDRRVNEIMIPRTEVVWLEQDETVSEFYATFGEAPHSRFPVYHETVDNVVGIVSIKDVLKALAGEARDGGVADGGADPAGDVHPGDEAGERAVLADAGRAAADGRRRRRVRRRGRHRDAGAAAGGDGRRVVDELGQPSEEYAAIDEHTTRVDGGMSIYDLREELEIELPEGDYETVAGFVLRPARPHPARGRDGDARRVPDRGVRGEGREDRVRGDHCEFTS